MAKGRPKQDERSSAPATPANSSKNKGNGNGANLGFEAPALPDLVPLVTLIGIEQFSQGNRMLRPDRFICLLRLLERVLGRHQKTFIH